MDFFLNLVAELASSLIFLGLAGLAVYWAILKNYKPLRAVGMGALMILMYIGGSFLIDQLSAHPASWAGIEQTFDQIWQSKAKVMADQKMSQADIDEVHGIFKQYFLYCLPAWMIIGAFFAGFLAYYLVSTIGSRLIPKIPLPIAFWQWVIPEPMIFGLIIGGVLKLFASGNFWMDVVGDNLLVLFLGVYTFSGLTITSFYLKKWRFPAIARFLSYILLFELTFNAVCVLGVMDIWMDFRKLKKPPVEPTP